MEISVRDLWWESYSLNLTVIGSLRARKRQHGRSSNWRAATSTRQDIQLFFAPILCPRRNEQIGQSPRRVKENRSRRADLNCRPLAPKRVLYQAEPHYPAMEPTSLSNQPILLDRKPKFPAKF